MIEIKTSLEINTITIQLIDTFTADDITSVENIWELEDINRTKKIIFNCKNVQMINSSGLGALVTLNKKATTNNIDLIFTNISISLKKLLNVTGLDIFFKIN